MQAFYSFDTTFFVVGCARSAHRSSKNVDEKGRNLASLGSGEPLASLADASSKNIVSANNLSEGSTELALSATNKAERSAPPRVR
jgi:hypothetical protein